MLYGLSVFFCWACGLARAACDVEPQRMQGSAWQQSVVRKVIDGDTLELEGGARVRMVGINAPETAKFGKPGDPLGSEAWLRLQTLAAPGQTLFFHRDKTHHDHYGRLLLHPFDSEGQNITARLLAEGMGFHVVIPPNGWQAECYRSVEQRATKSAQGVWGLAYYQPIDATEFERLHGGYSRVMGRIESVVLTRASAWVELEGHVSLKVAKQDLKTVDGDVWQRIVEAAAQQQRLDQLPRLEVRGWMSDRQQWGPEIRRQIADGTRKAFQFNVYHRYHWRWLDTTQSGQATPPAPQVLTAIP